MSKNISNYPNKITTVLDEHLCKEESVRLSQCTREELVQRLKFAYECLAEDEKRDVLIPEKESFLKAKEECVLTRYTRRKNKEAITKYEFNYNWPTNGGFLENPVPKKDLAPKEVYDRIGSAEGRNMCPHKNPPFTYKERALPYYISKKYADNITTHPAFHVYEVTDKAQRSKVEMKVGTTKEAFWKKAGGGTQVAFIKKTDNIESLKRRGLLREKIK